MDNSLIQMKDIKERIFGIIRSISRPEAEAVISYLSKSNYFTRGCWSHHKERGGLARHSLEVYEHMLSHAAGYPSDSIAVIALFHDLGKTVHRSEYGPGHGHRSVAILDELGFPLTREERTAIGHHHGFFKGDCPIRSFLKSADCTSARNWSEARHQMHGHHSIHSRP